jgi:hypothetical protein
MAALAGIVIGAPTTLSFHAAKAGTRATSSATTLGIANPILSTIEDIAAVVLTLIGLMAPDPGAGLSAAGHLDYVAPVQESACPLAFWPYRSLPVT